MLEMKGVEEDEVPERKHGLSVFTELRGENRETKLKDSLSFTWVGHF